MKLLGRLLDSMAVDIVSALVLLIVGFNHIMNPETSLVGDFLVGVAGSNIVVTAVTVLIGVGVAGNGLLQLLRGLGVDINY